MRTKLLSLLLLLAVCGSAAAQLPQSKPHREVPHDFKSDGCSQWPDGDYRDCCEAHDLDYYYGGTAADRKAADKRLYKCVRDKGHKVNAVVMFLGVRIGAIQWLPTPFRWGFGRKARKAAKAAAAAKAAEANSQAAPATMSSDTN